MIKYHKINSIFKRDADKKGHPLIEGDFATDEIAYLKDNLWEFTEKVDGTNIRIMWDGEVSFGGKTDNAQMPSQLVNTMKAHFTSELLEPVLGSETSVCLYGEGYGAKIQKGGGNYRPDQNVVLFDVKIGEFWLKREDVNDIAQKLEMDVVPIIGEGTLQDGIAYVKTFPRSAWGDFTAEGIVVRPKVEMFTRAGDRIITKIKCKDFRK